VEIKYKEELRIDRTTNQPSANKKTFGENSYYKNKKKDNNENNEDDLNKAKKTGKIINTGSKSQKIEDSDILIIKLFLLSVL
jgi:hypothetical protein